MGDSGQVRTWGSRTGKSYLRIICRYLFDTQLIIIIILLIIMIMIMIMIIIIINPPTQLYSQPYPPFPPMITANQDIESHMDEYRYGVYNIGGEKNNTKLEYGNNNQYVSAPPQTF